MLGLFLAQVCRQVKAAWHAYGWPTLNHFVFYYLFFAEYVFTKLQYAAKNVIAIKHQCTISAAFMLTITKKL